MRPEKAKKLRTGYTTGACAAAAAKAASLALLQRETSRASEPENNMVEIPFPDGSRHALKVGWINCGGFPRGMFASVIKDAGDDPDVTNGAEIQAKVVLHYVKSAKWPNGEMAKWDREEDVASSPRHGGSFPPVIIRGGKGVGRVTRPGLPVPVGESAINPGPRRMITDAVMEAFGDAPDSVTRDIAEIEVTIWVPEGEALARKTLNSRLGIIGGISILGTTGIVRPISAEAWTATISTSMNVAQAMNRREIVISSGRSSEKAHMEKYGLPEECYVMMGDYVEFSLREAKNHGFERINLVARWAKMLKTAMAIPQTHVRHGALNLDDAVTFLTTLGWSDLPQTDFNTAREMFELITTLPPGSYAPLLSNVCRAAKSYAQSVAGETPVSVHLVSYEGGIIAQHE